MNIILENVKIFLFVVNKSLSYLLFRVYRTEMLMVKAATTMVAARMERAVYHSTSYGKLLGKWMRPGQRENYPRVRWIHSCYEQEEG